MNGLEAQPSPDLPITPRVRGLEPSATLAINERSARLTAEGRRVYRLGLGQSPFPVPPSLVAALEANAAQKDYLPVQGLPELREAVAGYARRREGIAAGGDDVLVGPGTKELMFLLALVSAGELVIPTPSWVSYAPQARIAGRRVRWVPTDPADGWRLTPEALAAACADDPDAPRVLVLNYPSNPTGATYGPGALEALAEVARRHGVVVLSDEIYGGVHHDGRHTSIARYYPEGTIVSDGISKWCGAGGWRLGAFVFPPGLRALREAMTAVASETYTSVSAPVQHAAIRAFAPHAGLEEYLAGSRRVLSALGRWAAATLAAAGPSVAPPEGGFYLFPDLGPRAEGLRARGVATSRQLCERLLEETGVAVLPGADFGRPAEELTVRIAYVDFDGGAALRAAADAPAGEPLGAEWLEAHCPAVVGGIRALVTWLEE